MPRRPIAVFVLSALALTACQSASDTASPVIGGVEQGSSSISGSAETSAPDGAAPSDSAAVQADSDGGSVDASGSTESAAAPSDSAPDNSSANTASGDLLRVAGITDGDTIKVWIDGKREPVRLLGVDTPESRKPNTAVACYAKEATSKMQSLVQSKQVRLVADPTQVDRDKYNRLIRYVLLPDGSDVSQLMIAGGFGREYTYAAAYAKQGAFRVAQSQAQAARLGLWGACTYAAAFNPPSSSASATNPQQFAQPTPSAARPTTSAKPSATTPASGSCDIKGNISSSGEKIYHVPGQRNYAKTVISPGKGERMFCSEAEAQNAGWRRSKV